MALTLKWHTARLAQQSILKLPVQRGKKRLLRMLERWAQDGSGVVRFDQGQRIHVSLADHIESSIYRTSLYEPEVTEVFRRLVYPGATVLDVGAHVGYYTLLAAGRVGDTGQVHSFEPVPEIFQRLQANVALNRFTNVQQNPLALTEAGGTIYLYPANGRNSGTSSMVAERPENAATCVAVPSMPLDSYVRERQLGKVDLIKIDVEGAELLVLRGGQATLATSGPEVICEVGEPLFRAAGYDSNTLLEYMTSLNYRAYRIENRHGAFPYVYFSRNPRVSLPEW